MSWNQEFVDAFFNRDVQINAEKTSIRKGYWLILKCQRFRLALWLLWELMTTIIVYVPSTDLIKTVLQGVNARWEKLSSDEQSYVVLALRHLDKKKDISVTLKPNP